LFLKTYQLGWVVSGFLEIKTLLFGLLVASPAVGVWAMNRPNVPVVQEVPKSSSFGAVVALPADATRVPVEVLSKGSKPEWVYVEVGNQAVPEPGSISLLILAGTALAFRRQRP
jgi:hypothetical protein